MFDYDKPESKTEGKRKEKEKTVPQPLLPYMKSSPGREARLIQSNFPQITPFKASNYFLPAIVSQALAQHQGADDKMPASNLTGIPSDTKDRFEKLSGFTFMMSVYIIIQTSLRNYGH